MFQCSLCAEINNEEENNVFVSIIKPFIGLDTRRVFETEHWIVIPTLGCLLKGYLLIVTKQHFSSTATCPNELYTELELLINKIREVILKTYNLPVIIFEHGALSINNRGACCVEHTHLHVFPYNGDIMNDIERKGVKSEKIRSFDDLKRVVLKMDKPYLFYQNNFGERFLMFGEGIPSQYIRQIVSSKIGMNDKWDWRKHYFLENIKQTILDIKQTAIKNI